MTIEGAVGIGLLLAGSFLGVPVAVVLGIVVVLFEVVRQIWSRRGLTERPLRPPPRTGIASSGATRRR